MLWRVLKIAVPLLLVVVVAAGVWMTFTGARAVAAVQDLQDAVEDVQAAITNADLDALRSSAADAQDAARRADDALGGPVWAAVAAIPYVGDTPEAGRITADAVATAAEGLDPLLDVSDVLDPAGLYSEGRIAVDRLAQAQEPLRQAVDALTEASARMATAPTADDGAWVIERVDAERASAAQRLDEALEALTTTSAVADVLPAILGADGPRTWFVGLQTPAEARGTGGLPGNYLVLTADDGRFDLTSTGSNDDLSTLPELPDFGEDYRARYGEDPRLFNNSNVSPHFPHAGQLWRAFYEDSLDEDATIVAGLDVVALGSLVEATGSITLPDGQTLSRAEVVDFFLRGVYTDFPDRAERKAFQEAVTSRVFEALTTGETPTTDLADAIQEAVTSAVSENLTAGDTPPTDLANAVQEAVTSTVFEDLTAGDVPPTALVDAFAEIISEGRLQIWSPNEQEQDVLLDLPTAGSVTAEPGPYAYPVVIDTSGSKLNAYLERDFQYNVGRCPIDDRVESTLTLTLTSDIPDDEPLDAFVIGEAKVTPDGPVASVQFQVHLAPGAEVANVKVDGEPVGVFDFAEVGRPSLLLPLDLPPRQPVTVTVELTEPADATEASLVVQPLARDATADIVDVPCSG